MPGFIIEINPNKILRKDFGSYKCDSLIVESLEGDSYYIERRVNNKFLDEKLFKKRNNVVIVLDGVILNSKKLKQKYEGYDFFETVLKMYKMHGDEFFNEFRGSFSGALYDENENIWIVFTDHYGSKQVFYTLVNDTIIVASEINFISDYLRNMGSSLKLDEIGAYFLLTYGFMLEDYTLYSGIKKLIAGHYMKIKNGKIEIKRYYEIDNTPDHSLKEYKIVEKLDELFKKAVELEFEKDKKYGYKHLVSLSGGLDSRMVTMVAHELGYTDQLNYTFSQSDYLDDSIAKAIASDLGHEWIFKALDNGNYLRRIEDVVRIDFGDSFYAGHAHVYDIFRVLDISSYGLNHTGQLGDVIVGTYYGSPNPNKPWQHGDGGISRFLIYRIKDVKLKLDYKNQEIFKFYNRGFNGILQGNLIFQEKTEVVSPFLYKEFFDFALKIPLKYRYRHKIYFKWILQKHKNASKYPWEAIEGKVTSIKVNIKGYYISLRAFPKKVFYKIFYGGSANTKWHMNPLDYWYRTNEQLRSFMDEFFKRNLYLLNEYPELRNDCLNLYRKGRVVEKTLVLSLLQAVKTYVS